MYTFLSFVIRLSQLFYTIYKSFNSGYVLKQIFLFWELIIGSWILILTLVFHMLTTQDRTFLHKFAVPCDPYRTS
jgi:hypothetical protein